MRVEKVGVEGGKGHHDGDCVNFLSNLLLLRKLLNCETTAAAGPVRFCRSWARVVVADGIQDLITES